MHPLALAALVLLPPPAEAAPIEHPVPACVPADRYARIEARSPGATAAELQFRTRADGPWYVTRMAKDGEAWSAFLPRPARTLGEVEYRIVATGAGAERTETAPYRVRVGAPGECDDAGRTSVDAPIVVTVPAGAPVVPPVPAGFSPAGVVAAEAPKQSNLPLKIAGGVVAAGVVGVTAAGAAESTRDTEVVGATVPPIIFNGTQPSPGATLSRSRDRLTVLMRMAARPEFTLTLFWRVELRHAVDGRACLQTNGVHSAVPDTAEMTLEGLLITNVVCGTSFDVGSLRIGITHNNQLVYDQLVELPFRIEP